ncbi:MAG: roadblock/LC7 domain-containing protein [Candidatus Thorarchaeota archaeon]
MNCAKIHLCHPFYTTRLYREYIENRLEDSFEVVIMSSRVDRINSSIRDFETVPGVEGAALVSLDGLMISSALPESEQERVAAISAAMLSLGEKATTELDRGDLLELYVKGDKGYTLLTSVGDSALLLVLAKVDAQLGLIFVDMKRMSEKLEEIL